MGFEGEQIGRCGFVIGNREHALGVPRAASGDHNPARDFAPVIQDAELRIAVRLQSGETVTVDEAYVRESILQPAAKVASGFQPIMPTFQGLVTEEQLLELIEYVKSLKALPQTEAR